VLQDVRVLALDDTVTTQASGDAPTRVQAGVAVLELSPDEARTLAAANALGDISLSLRSVETGTADAGGSSNRAHQRQGTILVHAFGTVSAGGGR
jgi:Flp pilus assembly protein CpaB